MRKFVNLRVLLDHLLSKSFTIKNVATRFIFVSFGVMHIYRYIKSIYVYVAAAVMGQQSIGFAALSHLIRTGS